MKTKPTKHVLGRPIVFPASTELTNSIAGMRSAYGDDMVSVIIGIGKDHTAELIMDLDALQALQDPGNDVRVAQAESMNPLPYYPEGILQAMRKQLDADCINGVRNGSFTATPLGDIVQSAFNRGEITQEEYDWFKTTWL